MIEFVYNNTKNINTDHISFNLNCSYHPYISFKDTIYFYLNFYLANKLAKELRDIMSACQPNLFYAQKIQKQAHDKGV